MDRGFPPAALSFETSDLGWGQQKGKTRGGGLDAQLARKPVETGCGTERGRYFSTGPTRTGLSESSHVNVAYGCSALGLASAAVMVARSVDFRPRLCCVIWDFLV